jgi:hypothetical protein
MITPYKFIELMFYKDDHNIDSTNVLKVELIVALLPFNDQKVINDRYQKRIRKMFSF